MVYLLFRSSCFILNYGKTDYFFCAVRLGQIYYHQLPAYPKPESGIFYFGNQPSATRNRTEWSRIFFLTPEEFKQRIANNEFLEYEEVYTDRFMEP